MQQDDLSFFSQTINVDLKNTLTPAGVETSGLFSQAQGILPVYRSGLQDILPNAAYLPIMPKIVPDRIVIYPCDIANITGCSDRTARLILQRIRKIRNKTADKYITIKEFCFIFRTYRIRSDEISGALMLYGYSYSKAGIKYG